RAAEEPVDGDAGQAAGHDGIRDRVADEGGAAGLLAEGLLARVGGGLLPVEAQLVDHGGAEDARPARHPAVGLDGLVAEGGGPGAVEDASEGAGDVPLAVRVDVAP